MALAQNRNVNKWIRIDDPDLKTPHNYSHQIIDKEAKHTLEKSTVLLTNGAQKAGSLPMGELN